MVVVNNTEKPISVWVMSEPYWYIEEKTYRKPFTLRWVDGDELSQMMQLNCEPSYIIVEDAMTNEQFKRKISHVYDYGELLGKHLVSVSFEVEPPEPDDCK